MKGVVQRVPLLVNFVYECEKEVKKQGRKLKSKINKFDFTGFKKVNATLIGYLANLRKNEIRKFSDSYIENEIRLIRLNVKTLRTDGQMHDLRIHIKTLQEIINLNRKLFDKKMYRDVYEKLKQLTELIGEWHDKVIFMDELNRYIQYHSDAAEKNKIKGLLKVVNRDIQSHKKEIKAKLSLI